ncbi:MAG: hypothetical protein EOP50_01910 [Sphingobacteriales bacterium]|nr:MAG: hypothetical protein EOP50_01910 [Sphingobacteriales bacterium]
MRGTVVVETQEEYNAWIATKQPQYLAATQQNAPAAPAQEPGKMNKIDTAAAAPADTTKRIASLR